MGDGTVTGEHASPLAAKKVLVIGAGAAGLACAWSLARFPDKFEVHVWEKEAQAGGVCTSEDVGNGDWINDGVQGAAPSYRNTFLFHDQFGFKHEPVHMKVAFGKGPTAWNNVAPTPLIHEHQREIERFGRVLKHIMRLKFIYAFIPIRRVLALHRFSKSFRDHLVFPLTALFFGTGNQTPRVSSVVVASVFLDPDVRLFDYDPERLLSQQPDFYAFKKLSDVYGTIAGGIGAHMHYNRPIAQIRRRNNKVHATDGAGVEEVFDEVVFSCNAEAALKSLQRPRFWERFVLGHVRYFNDVTVTHEDEAYMRRHYEFDNERGDMYFIRTDPDNSEVLEMSFNLSNYQGQLRGSGRNVYQTIFLNDEIRQRWTKPDIAEDKVLMEKWWRQMSHTWRHFLFVVPWVRFMQGRKHTWYCGAYTLFNTHELAIVSGLAVAQRLGADYPFDHDQLAATQFDKLMQISHGVNRHKRSWWRCFSRRRRRTSSP
ncbi:hypothetical protein PTSG_05529 [Salpingoeca rosetta]|uniref:Amine oxidase domain-containing protein n=1 Tax=Salpingoeca rosetta (strain ATCC 50818 / BSB-021) TaxID=946362 RepID=F2UBG9_SALR5|nr:uncharacterized protein PTSG_05529 [Salpingoeca rosetta]EGD73835.1 hypothetical protein PTSG_05529 [Salpingoeca rosetta]|eukprot:XP_004993398.1 hypothetical protein PTSG_05529 [Salpingoeca rosetta]